MGISSALFYPLDLGSQNGQVLHEQRVAAIDVEDVVDLSVPVGDQPREHQAGAGPDVRAPHRRAGKLRQTPHHRVVAVDLPGFGDSALVDELDSRRVADALADVIEQLDLGPVHLTGQDVSGAATPLLGWSNPVSNDPVSLGFRQAIGANDALRTGSYSKTLTFTLSTTHP